MTTNEPQPVTYQPGQIVNGHVWTGSEWLPVAQSKPPHTPSVWITLGAILSFVVAVGAGVQALDWLFGGINLENDGNPFAGVLTLFGMGALVVAAGFAILGMFLINKNKGR